MLHLAGRGAHPTSPIRVQGVQNLVLYFERDFKDPITLETNAITSQKRAPIFEMTGGHLEVIGARIRLNVGTTVPTMFQVDEGSLSLTRCWLLGPHVKATDGFLNLINITNATPEPTTLLLRDNILMSSKILIQMQNQVQLKARNNLFLALGDGVHFDTRDQSAPLLHVLDHNTWAARHAVFTMPHRFGDSQRQLNLTARQQQFFPAPVPRRCGQGNARARPRAIVDARPLELAGPIQRLRRALARLLC